MNAGTNEFVREIDALSRSINLAKLCGAFRAIYQLNVGFEVLTDQRIEQKLYLMHRFTKRVLSFRLGQSCGGHSKVRAVLEIQLMSYSSVWRWMGAIHVCRRRKLIRKTVSVCLCYNNHFERNLCPSTWIHRPAICRRLWNLLIFFLLHFGRFDLVPDCKLIFAFNLRKKK